LSIFGSIYLKTEPRSTKVSGKIDVSTARARWRVGALRAGLDDQQNKGQALDHLSLGLEQP